jgi:hypothetical protein
VYKIDTRQSNLYRVSDGGTRQRFLKTQKPFFVECLSAGTRQRGLCRVLVSGHSAKTSLPSVGSRALGKVYFLIKKSLPNARSQALSKDVKLKQQARARLLLTYARAAGFISYSYVVGFLTCFPALPPPRPASPRHASPPHRRPVASPRPLLPPAPAPASPRHHHRPAPATDATAATAVAPTPVNKVVSYVL